MNVYIIIGPQAVGKMTVAQKVAKKTGAHLFYNHMTIDLVEQFFPYGSAKGDWLVKEYRRLLFHAINDTSDYPGLIFTFLCDFDSDDGKAFLLEICNLFSDRGHTVCIIELYSDYNIRKKRNFSVNRCLYKKQKRHIIKSREIFEYIEQKTRANSKPGEIEWKHYLRIDNSKLSPRQATKIILRYIESVNSPIL